MNQKTLFVLTVVATTGSLILSGCSGNGGGKDPYAQVTLQEVTRGPVVASKGFRYKLVAPEVLEKSGYLCLVREGDIEELIVGRNLAERLEGLDPNDIQFNVVKKFTPFVHFQCEQIVSGEDTVFISQASSRASTHSHRRCGADVACSNNTVIVDGPAMRGMASGTIKGSL